MSIIPVIIAGGLGSRLWPLSSKDKPKPFIKLFGDHSLFQKTLLRVAPFLEGRLPLVVTNEAFHSLCQEQAAEIDMGQYYSVLEPCLRNTAPAIVAAAKQLYKEEQDPIMLVLPADHIIEPFEAFAGCISNAISFAEKGHIVTFGIEPTEPKTCYGYIKEGQPLDGNGFTIEAFKEKPDQETAKAYTDSKAYLWNSGMFMAKASVFLEEMKKHSPDDLIWIEKAIQEGQVEGTHTWLNHDHYSKVTSDSIDYCIMEKTERGVVVPARLEWSDIGTWNAYWDHHEKDDLGNLSEGPTTVCESKGCLFISEGVEIIGFGLEDIVAISTGDKVMITTKAKAPELKKVLKYQESKTVTP